MGPSEYFILILFIALGVFSIVAALFDFDWYFETSGATTFVRWLGRKGARVFYALLGAGLIACGTAGLLYW
ncbi:immunity 17 family protein [Parabacteroides sp. APC149_11_2_Y6]